MFTYRGYRVLKYLNTKNKELPRGCLDATHGSFPYFQHFGLFMENTQKHGVQ